MKRPSPSTFIDYSNDRRANWYISRHNGSFGSTPASCPLFFSLLARKSNHAIPTVRRFTIRALFPRNERNETRHWIFYASREFTNPSRYLPSRCPTPQTSVVYWLFLTFLASTKRSIGHLHAVPRNYVAQQFVSAYDSSVGLLFAFHATYETYFRNLSSWIRCKLKFLNILKVYIQYIYGRISSFYVPSKRQHLPSWCIQV